MKANWLNQVITLRKRAWRASASSSQLGLAGKSLRTFASFRLLAAADRDPLIGFRVLMRMRGRFQHPSSFNPRLLDGDGILVLDGLTRRHEKIARYIGSMTREPVAHFISRDDLPGPVFSGGRPPLRWWRFALVQAVFCLFSSERKARALGIFSVLELAWILEYAQQNRVKHMVDFAPYLVDSNLLYVLLKEQGIKLTKVPSSGPLSTHHKIMLADEVALSTPYHEFEVEGLGNQFQAEQRLRWIPEHSLDYYAKYATETAPQPKPQTLGYYSHGSWVRKAAGHTGDDWKIGEQEAELLSALARFVKQHPDWTLVVFPHPREKAPEMLQQTREYYGQFLPLDRIDLRLESLPTSQQFEAADVGVAVFSTIVFERLFCGYKMRMFNTENPHFPSAGTSLNNLCVRSEEELLAHIEQAANRSRSEDFENLGIEGYRWDSFPIVAMP